MPRTKQKARRYRNRAKPYSMTEVENGLEKFASTGRTGRRNALPDVLDAEFTSVGTGALTAAVLQCQVEEKKSAAGGTTEKDSEDKTSASAATNGQVEETEEENKEENKKDEAESDKEG